MIVGHMTKIAVAYVHLAPYSISISDTERLGNVVSEHALSVAKKRFEIPIEISVRLEQGSLKGWITASCVVAGALYHGVATYPEFKDGLRAVVEDGRHFSAHLIRLVTDVADPDPASVFRTERRAETPGRMLRLLSRLEHLGAEYQTLPQAEVAAALKEISNLANKIGRDLMPEDAAMFRGLVASKYQEIEHQSGLIGLLDPGNAPPLDLPLPIKTALPVQERRQGPRLLGERHLTLRPPEPPTVHYLNRFSVSSEHAPQGSIVVEPQMRLDVGNSLDGEDSQLIGPKDLLGT